MVDECSLRFDTTIHNVHLTQTAVSLCRFSNEFCLRFDTTIHNGFRHRLLCHFIGSPCGLYKCVVLNKPPINPIGC